jgi:hypothetical protein
MKKAPVTKHVTNVGVAALARECGISQAAISKKLKAGKTPDHIRMVAAQKQGRAPNRKGPGRPPLPSEYDLVIQGRERMDALEEAKLRRAKALAERQELENMLRRGELLPVSYVRRWATRFLIDGRDEMLRMGSELGDTLAAESDPVKCRAIIRAGMERALAKFEQLNTIWRGNRGDELTVA